MKRIVLFLFMACPFSLFAQEKRDAPFKGAKRIIVNYNISGDSLYTFLAKSLLNEGYVIKAKDRELGTVTTEPKHIKFIDYRINVRVDGSEVVFTGSANSGMGLNMGGFTHDSQWMDVEYRSKADLRRNAFDDIVRFVESTQPVKIEYSK
ncbi:hypothetical protein SAMN04488128_103196 [Chitinophaga eiseniae]|uniref:PLD phosphodiesterase domain-containing protein n=1 Tax=Chitinophaga eiseniae TaxID=634771 RepID=A0A1T4SNX8_9BACT|nr:hypothetical protein [Chitinophaga eiseniae]SKA29970.1 hypothetical protein SAMN04488128_103196 [Chitinophaga eiseniae]